VRVLKIIVGAAFFVACVFVATANMHEVRLAFPDVPIRGWPHVDDVYAPLFVVILTSLFLGVVLTGLSTLLEQVRLRTVARRARKERDRATAALAPTANERDAAIAERNAAVAERDAISAERDRLSGDVERARAELAQARGEVDGVRDERDALRAEVERLRGATEAHATPSSAPEPSEAQAHAMIEGEEAS
jgi:uncharacterized integral membrane protein